MSMYRMVFFGAAAFLAAVGIFVGLVMMLTSLQSGSITMSYNAGGKAVVETITRVADPGRYWQWFLGLGVAPFAIGAAVLWYSVRRLRMA